MERSFLLFCVKKQMLLIEYNVKSITVEEQRCIDLESYFVYISEFL